MNYLKELDAGAVFRAVMSYKKQRNDHLAARQEFLSKILPVSAYKRRIGRLDKQFFSLCKSIKIKPEDLLRLYDMTVVNHISERDFKLFQIALMVMVAEYEDNLKEVPGGIR